MESPYLSWQFVPVFDCSYQWCCSITVSGRLTLFSATQAYSASFLHLFSPVWIVSVLQWGEGGEPGREQHIHFWLKVLFPVQQWQSKAAVSLQREWELGVVFGRIPSLQPFVGDVLTSWVEHELLTQSSKGTDGGVREAWSRPAARGDLGTNCRRSWGGHGSVG